MCDHLNCKRCGYKQYDPGTIAAYRERYPDMECHDIPYICGACSSNEMDKDQIYDEMCEEYDDDPWCGTAVASAIAGVAEDCDHAMSDQEIMRKVYDYIQDVMIQSLWDYVESHKKDILVDILGYCKE